jgi:hypothetical protein
MMAKQLHTDIILLITIFKTSIENVEILRQFRVLLNVAGFPYCTMNPHHYSLSSQTKMSSLSSGSVTADHSAVMCVDEVIKQATISFRTPGLPESSILKNQFKDYPEYDKA